MKIRIVTCLSLALACVCGAQQTSAPASKAAGKTAASPATAADDPCRYLLASEVEPYTGPLVAPPYRANLDSGYARRTGDACLYRGKDGRGVYVQYSPAGGRVAGTAGRRVPAVLDRTLASKSGEQDGTEHQGMGASVMGPAGAGPWDNSNWFPTGTIIVFKGDSSFDIDISATSAGKTRRSISRPRPSAGLVTPSITTEPKRSRWRRSLSRSCRRAISYRGRVPPRYSAP